MDNEEVTDIPLEEEGVEVIDFEAIMAQYRHRQRVEAMIGPTVSILLHIVLVISAFMFFTGGSSRPVAELEVTVEELEVKELDKQELEELEEVEELVEEVVPTVEKPEIQQDATDISTDDFSDEMAQTDNDMDLSSVLDIKASDTPLKISGLYGGRMNQGRRASMLRKGGGNRATETAVLRALRWLKKTQKTDGSWSRTCPDAMTGLGLLTFLAHGETPESKEFGMTVQRALEYLTKKMMAYPGNKSPGYNLDRAYTNGIVTYALSEAYGLTNLPIIKPAMEKGLARIVNGQQPNGGFDYNYKKGARWDLSVAGWQVQALKAGFVANADVPGIMEAIDKAVSFLTEVSFSKEKGKFGYSAPGSGSNGMQGAGTLCLQLVGKGHTPAARTGVKYINDHDKVVWDRTKKYSAHSTPVYNWYYETQAMFHAGKSSWNRWNKQMSREIVKSQVRDPDFEGKPCGHWISPGGNWKREEYDPWYATTLCALTLQVYYRYLPTYKMPKKMAKKAPTLLDELDDDIELE